MIFALKLKIRATVLLKSKLTVPQNLILKLDFWSLVHENFEKYFLKILENFFKHLFLWFEHYCNASNYFPPENGIHYGKRQHVVFG